MKRYAVRVDGAALPAGDYEPISLRCKPSSSPNVPFHIDEVVNAIGRPLRSVEEDWLDLLRALHATDLVCHRGENEEWNRLIVLSVRLRDPEPFEPVVGIVKDLFGRMTHDLLDLPAVPCRCVLRPPALRRS